MLVSATFVELLPAPRVLPYVALFVLFAIALRRAADARARGKSLAGAAAQRATVAYSIYIGLLQLAREVPARLTDEDAFVAELLQILDEE